MKKHIHSLTNILASTFKIDNNKVKKRLIYNKAFLGGLDNKWMKLALILLPFVMYAAIFNPISFALLGIAQAIIAYIILLVFAMQIIIAVSYYNNKKVVKVASDSWETYFTDVDFKTILSSGVTPYVDFVKHYEGALHDNLDEKELETRLKNAFIQMQEENRDMFEAMQKDKVNTAG